VTDAESLFHRRETCRLCDSEKLKKILSFPSCPPVDNYRYANEPEIFLPDLPMDLYMCSECGHAQLLDVVKPEILFGNYIYTSTSSPDLQEHFEGYVEALRSKVNLKSDDFVVDIGSNDGLLLKILQANGCRVQGVDPAESVAKGAIENGIPTIVSFLNEAVVKKVLAGSGPADFVTANNVFSHSDDLRSFARMIRCLLKPEGVFVFEVSYLKDLVNNKVLDYVYHEHLAHHSVAPLKRFFESIGMRLFDVEHVDIKGGSIRGFASLVDSTWEDSGSVELFIKNEMEMGLYGDDVYVGVTNYFSQLKSQINAHFRREMEMGHIIASYGASATTTVLLKLLGIEKYVSFIIDDNIERQGRLSPGDLIPVYPRSFLLDKKPSVTFIAAWRFADLIIPRNTEYLESGGKFIVPLPNVRIVSAYD